MQEFYTLLIAAIIISKIPTLNIPFKTIETFFHEMSHALITFLTFGKIHRIHIQSDGTGYCELSGGIKLFSAFSGYIGASSAGVIIYYIGLILKTTQAEKFLYGFMVFIIFVTLRWARDFRTVISLILIGFLFYFPLKHELYAYTNIYLKFIGIYICLSAVWSPLHLIDGKREGDGAALFKITLIPEFIWIIVWVLYGLFCLYNIYLLSTMGDLLWITII